ncbi:MAG: ABC transporter permease [Lachnospiraceae bacterium]|nr:ABC transporter permease [Lachnospiraceae bacterium]
MRISDLFSMSFASLRRRKLRSVLTILGVVIGIASIVIMISLGLGMSQQAMEQIDQYGGIKTVTITEGNSSDSASDRKAVEYKLDDELVERIEKMDHVETVSPVLLFDCVIKDGRYTYRGWGCQAYRLDALKNMGWEFDEGGWPKEGDELKFVYGNLYQIRFYTDSGNDGYWDTGIMPDVDAMKDSLFMIFDTEAYESYNSKNNEKELPMVIEEESGGADGEADVKSTSPPKRYMIPTAGVLFGNHGDEDYWRDYTGGVYCDIEPLLKLLKREFKGKVIPGQPTRKNGSAFRKIYYDEIYVKMDDYNYVKDFQKEIQDLGYNTSSNTEWIEETQEQARSMQAMLGGIGAISLLVAAIGIANTMMMSIYERTKEIGIFKVLGCDLKDIGAQFLIEAALIGLIGGVLGNVLSIIAMIVINTVTEAKTSLIPVWLALVGLLFAVLIGTVSGFFPARRAMRLSALNALRNE